MPSFLEWWENQQTDALALQLADVYVEGITQPWLSAIGSNSPLPAWVQTMLRWRLVAQWVYQQGLPLSQKVQRGLPGLLTGLPSEVVSQFQITPQDIANIPPAVRNAFLQGNRFSLGWIKRLSDDAKQMMGDLMAINRLKNQNPRAIVPLLEQILRRDLAAQAAGVSPGSLTPQQLQEWIDQAQFRVLQGVAQRAQLISQTEGMRMQNLGILTGLEEKDQTFCFVMPHAGSCPECQRLIDGRVFRIATMKENLFKNFGKKKHDWVPALPQHPQCRHSPMEIPYQFRAALKGFGKIPDDGVLLEWYGLPGKEPAFKALGLPRKPWLSATGQVV